MPFLGGTELFIILVLVMIVFGAGKLASVGPALGKSVRDFRRTSKEDESAEANADEEHANRPKAL